MRIETIREFIALARWQSFSVAARKCAVSQPTMSTHIAALEREVGTPLVERSGSFALTTAGKTFLEGMQQVVDLYDKTMASCSSQRKEAAPVRIKTTGDLPPLNKALAGVKGIPFRLVDIPQDTYAPLEELDRGLVDICTCADFSFWPDMVAYARERDYACSPAFADAQVLCMSSDHPLAQKKTLCREDLRGALIGILSSKWYDLMVHAATHVLGEDLGLIPRMIPLESRASLHFVDVGSALCLCGIGYEALLERDDITVFDTIDGEPITVPVNIVYRAHDPNPNVLAMVEALARGAGE